MTSPRVPNPPAALPPRAARCILCAERTQTQIHNSRLIDPLRFHLHVLLRIKPTCAGKAGDWTLAVS